jgi:hypothetical protein
VAHLLSQQLVSFFSILAAGYVQEHPIHHAADNTLVIAFAPRRNPPDFINDVDSEIEFVGTEVSAGGVKGDCDAVPVCGVDVRGQVRKRDLVAPGFAP